MADVGLENDQAVRGTASPPRVPGYFSGLFQPGLADPHAARHVHPPSPVETILFGFHFDGVSQGADSFQISPRLQGFSAILEIHTRVSRVAGAGLLHGLGLALARAVPASAAAFNALTQILPNASSTQTQRNLMEWTSRDDGLLVKGRFAFQPMNRAIVVRWINQGAGTTAAWVGLVIEKPH